MEKDESPSVYYGASEFHLHYDNFVLEAGEPIKPFMKEEPLEECTWLDMKKCSGVIDSTTFNFFPSVEYISLKDCKIRSCSPVAFATLAKLKTLDLINCEFPFEKDIFEGAQNIKNLSISNFHFSDNGDIFSNLMNLSNLSFEHCTFDIIEKVMFSGLHNLECLSLNYSEINKFAVDCFHGLDTLTGLNIRHNKINEFDSNCILNLVKLERLSFHHNETSSEINFQVFQQLPALQSFFFDNAVYESLDFSGFKSLKEVEIGYAYAAVTDKQIAKKLDSMNIEYRYVFCGKVEIDETDEDFMVCC